MGFLASCASVALILGTAISALRSRKVFVLAGGGVILLVLVFLVPSVHLILRFAETNDQSRAHVWRETLPLIRGYSLFGCGLGGYGSAFVMFKQSGAGIDQDYAHNDYLQYLSELGLVGFTLALFPLAIILSTTWRNWRRSNPNYRWLSLACAASFLAIGLHSFVDFNLYVPANMFLLAYVCGIAAHVGGTVQEDEENFI
jgi:O-antigen ligase